MRLASQAGLAAVRAGGPLAGTTWSAGVRLTRVTPRDWAVASGRISEDSDTQPPSPREPGYDHRALMLQEELVNGTRRQLEVVPPQLSLRYSAQTIEMGRYLFQPRSSPSLQHPRMLLGGLPAQQEGTGSVVSLFPGSGDSRGWVAGQGLHSETTWLLYIATCFNQSRLPSGTRQQLASSATSSLQLATVAS